MNYFALILFLGFTLCLGGCQQGVSSSGKGLLVFPKNEFSFGELKEGAVVGHRFKCINEGSGPVVILDVKKGCGCTDVKFSSEPLLPGDSSTVELIFDTKGWSGMQVKRVVVVANDSIGSRELKIWANINQE